MCAHLRILCLWDILFLLFIFPVVVCALCWLCESRNKRRCYLHSLRAGIQPCMARVYTLCASQYSLHWRTLHPWRAPGKLWQFPLRGNFAGCFYADYLLGTWRYEIHSSITSNDRFRCATSLPLLCAVPFLRSYLWARSITVGKQAKRTAVDPRDRDRPVPASAWWQRTVRNPSHSNIHTIVLAASYLRDHFSCLSSTSFLVSRHSCVNSWPARFCFGFVKTKTFSFDRSKYHCKTKKTFCFGFAQNQNRTQNRAGQVNSSNSAKRLQFNWTSSLRTDPVSAHSGAEKQLETCAKWRQWKSANEEVRS